MPDFVNLTAALRDQAWEALQTSTEYNAFKALDDAVVRLGGTSIVAEPAATPINKVIARVLDEAQQKAATQRKITQADVAENVLRQKGVPMPTEQFMEAAIKAGAGVGGNNPINNFRSVLSRDNRFESIMREGLYFWWLKDTALPSGWNEATGPDLLDGPVASSVHSSQEGGESHEATTH